MSSYKPAYFRVASVDPSQPPQQPQQPQQHQQQSTTDPAEFVRDLLAKEACCEATSVRPLFCQLDQLNSVPGPDGLSLTQVWREKFRWIKFEEELEVTGNRWSVPYVPVLSPFSVMEARRQLDSGLTLLMKVDSDDGPAAAGGLKCIAEEVEANLVTRLGTDAAEEVKRLLLTRHINFVEKVEDKDEENAGRKTNKKYRKKVHKDAEGCSIMVGAVQTLRAPVSVFVRLEQPLKDEPLMEIDLPIRFLYLLLGPKPSALSDLVLVAKAVATLMTDEIFHKVAYLANSKVELIAGVDEFLKCSSILPPIGCSLTDRIPPPMEKPNTEHRHADQKEPQEPAVVEHGEAEGLQRTGRLFGGLVQDVKRRAPWYKSDFLDALHPQTIGSFFFIYFACIAPIITFGGMLSDATNGYLGAMESILSGLICGVSYALFAGQPLTILGSTGPVLVFETIVFKMCDRYHWDYLPFRWWIGMWTALLLLVTVALDLSYLVKYITRFTEESFALLIAVIFVYEALAKLFKISSDYPVNKYWHPKHEVIVECECLPNDNLTELIPVPPKMARQLPTYRDGNVTVANFSAMDYYSWDHDLFWRTCPQYGGVWVGRGCGLFNVPDVFFFSCLLFIATFFLCYTLKKARASSLFPTFVRRLISDFAVMIAICVVTSVDYIMDLHTPKLLIPVSFEPTLGYTYRGWVVRPFGNNPWFTSLIAIGPALLATILVFLDQQITSVIVNRRENKMRKGAGFHLDLLVVAVCIAINSALGLPWFVAATVLSINHVLSLREESECTAPGERPVLLGCRENRVTGLLVFLCIGLSVFMSPLLRHIPMPVLYGVFLFMGVASLNGMQLFDRFLLLLQPRKNQPDMACLREVKLWRVHLFTGIQLGCFALLWVVKKISLISIAFPLMVLSLCFARKLLDYVFTRNELRLLDDLLPEQKLEETIRLRRRSRMSTAVDLEELAQAEDDEQEKAV
ncbi:hypothetical protein BOX15_Mlig025573g1 [Macrostomum lignano]|uniref:Anion exchange protein n=1 Tax=Macrostomum lignano TaxID=282301 RepID=A0A267F140_9PLAT|nr:hypothetical protein BOX15_Mlig025573g1 [Macrostomum lignano]